MKIAVIGTGYVGLVTGTCFAEAGNEVTCIDIDASKVASMQKGVIPIYEPGLEELFRRNIQEERLTFTTELAAGIEGSEIIFLALPTPPGEDGSADLSYILDVSEKLGSLLKTYTVIVDKSTVPVGTAEKVHTTIKQSQGTDFDVVSNPEFLREGFAVADFMKPDRVVIGTSSERAKEVMNRLYKPFLMQGNPILFMDERSAEMTKYAANSFLATKISFMNEISNLCEKLGANVDDVRLGIGSDERIGKRFLFPGIGYGGSCFPKDVMALQYASDEVGYKFKILSAVTEVNKLQKHVLIEKVNKYYDKQLAGKKFCLWGLAFKPDTDDVREAPAFEIIDALISAGASVCAFDPEAVSNTKLRYPNTTQLSFSEGPYEALAGCDALLIATEWSEFRTPDFAKLRSNLKHPVIFDGRNIYDLDTMKAHEFYYESIGRPAVTIKEPTNV
ncbi:MAG: UDP-glucose dehydrogenase [Candidatus Saccharibacteria bacterium]|nr:UDP-glucose dehydrogenase [Candidatus Saccharibacteria bacterium]